MRRFKHGDLHSGTGKKGKDGPVVKNRKQAIAIALSACGKSKFTEKMQSLGYSEEAAEAIYGVLFGEERWQRQFETGKAGPNNPGNYAPASSVDIKSTLTSNGTGKKTFKVPDYYKSLDGDTGSDSLAGVSLPKGPANPQGGSSTDVNGMQQLG